LCAGLAEAQAPKVGVATFSPTDFPIVNQYVGLVQGNRQVTVATEIAGRVLRVNFDEGSWVERGKILYEIDSQTAAPRVQGAQVAVDDARLKLDFATEHLARLENLFSKGAIAKDEFESAKTAREGALNQLNAANAVLDEIKAQADLTQIKAPIDGYVGLSLKREGDLVAPGDPSSAAMTTVEDVNNVKVTFYIPENHVRRYRDLSEDFGVDLDGPYETSLDLGDGKIYPHYGVLEYGGGRVDPKTGVVLARAAFPNPDLYLFSGQIVRINVTIMILPGVLAIPQTAFIHDPKGLTLAVVGQDGIVEFRPVKALGPINTYFILRDSETLKEGEAVIVEGLSKVWPGQKVDVEPVELASSRPNVVPGEPSAAAPDASSDAPGEASAATEAPGTEPATPSAAAPEEPNVEPSEGS
jgi:membrane fusion protein (multidrug efflux system)